MSARAKPLAVISAKDVRWTMNWSDKPPEEMFEDGPAMAVLLAHEVVFLHDHWWASDWPEDAQKVAGFSVICNDIFAWGCSDAEGLPLSEIKDLFEHWEKDREWGAAVWCMKRRNQMPQKPVEDLIRKAGVWDLDAMGLRPNTLDAEVSFAISKIVSPTPPHGEEG